MVIKEESLGDNQFDELKRKGYAKSWVSCQSNYDQYSQKRRGEKPLELGTLVFGDLGGADGSRTESVIDKDVICQVS